MSEWKVKSVDDSFKKSGFDEERRACLEMGMEFTEI